MRVISLLPSATECLAAIGADHLLVGRSHECDHPARLSDRPVLTEARTRFTSAAEVDQQVRDALGSGNSLYRLDTDRLRELRPDLIITQDLCDVCSIDLDTVRGVARTLDPEPRVLSLNPTTFEQVLDDLTTIGAAVGLRDRAVETVVALRERFSCAADHVTPFAEPVRTLFLEWTDPLFAGGHWTPQLVERAGGSHPANPTAPVENAGAGEGAHAAHRVAGKSAVIAPDDAARLEPRAIIVCPCGLSLEQTRAAARGDLLRADWFRRAPAFAAGRVALVDGNQMFNRPGPRLVDAFCWLVGFLNGRPELIPDGFPWEPMDLD